MKQGAFFLLVGCVLVVVAEETSNVKKNPSENVCVPGEEVTKNCGVCKCNAEGTEYKCAKECTENQKLSQISSENDEKCTPGEMFKRGCNECKCTDSGMKSQALCTIIACPTE